jgi:ankyrin repeat protein
LKSNILSWGPATEVPTSRMKHFREMTMICLTYLSFEDFTDDISRALEYSTIPIDMPPLLHFAALHWSRFLLASGLDSSSDDIWQAFQRMSKSATIFRFLRFVHEDGRYNSWVPPGVVYPGFVYYYAESGIGVVIASYLGLQDFVRKSVETGHIGRNSYSMAIIQATFEGHESIVRYLLDVRYAVCCKQGTEIKFRTHHVCNIRNDIWRAVLILATWRGHKSLVRLFVKNGADIEAKNDCYETLLQQAVSWGQDDIVRFLVNSGAEINAKGGGNAKWGRNAKWGTNALYVAITCRNVPIVRFLLEKGANPNTGRSEFELPFYAMDFFLEKGASVFDADDDENKCTALHLAVVLEEEDIVRLLVEKGADVNSKVGDYSNALELALFMAGHRGNPAARNIATFIQQYFPTEDFSSDGMSSEGLDDVMDCDGAD